jgi:hypothetical protein
LDLGGRARGARAKQKRPRHQLADVGGQGLKKEAADAALLAPKEEEEEAPGEFNTHAALPLARPTPRIKVKEEVRTPTDFFDVLWNSLLDDMEEKGQRNYQCAFLCSIVSVYYFPLLSFLLPPLF